MFTKEKQVHCFDFLPLAKSYCVNSPYHRVKLKVNKCKNDDNGIPEAYYY